MKPRPEAPDIFISYSSKDKGFAQRLARELAVFDVRVWIDSWEMKVGDSLIDKIEAGISAASFLGIVLSPNSVGSPWVRRELKAALDKELADSDVFVLPILYQDCVVPLFLRDKKYADFRQSFAEGLEALVDAIQPAIQPQVIQGLLSENRTLVLSAYSKIPRPKQEAYRAFLVRQLDAASASHRMAALSALFLIRDRGMLGLLLRMVDDRSNLVRQRALFIMGELRAKDALRQISERLSDGNPDVRAAAREAHRKVTGNRR